MPRQEQVQHVGTAKRAGLPGVGVLYVGLQPGAGLVDSRGGLLGQVGVEVADPEQQRLCDQRSDRGLVLAHLDGPGAVLALVQEQVAHRPADQPLHVRSGDLLFGALVAAVTQRDGPQVLHRPEASGPGQPRGRPQGPEALRMLAA
ncbi:MAG: hypothetical protein ACYTF5_22200, partial [Planctomycetota bacterium]